MKAVQHERRPRCARAIIMIIAALLCVAAAHAQCNGTVSPNPLVMYSIDWYDIDPWGYEVYIYTSPVGSGSQTIFNGLPTECIINAVYVVVMTPPLTLWGSYLFQPYWFDFTWGDNVPQGLCGWTYPAVCGGQMVGSLIKLATGQVQPVSGVITLLIFKQML